MLPRLAKPPYPAVPYFKIDQSSHAWAHREVSDAVSESRGDEQATSLDASRSDLGAIDAI